MKPVTNIHGEIDVRDMAKIFDALGIWCFANKLGYSGSEVD
jgi:hypothetical protein